MRKRERFFLTFFSFLFLSALLFFVAKASWFSGIRAVFESGLKPFQQAVSSFVQFPQNFSDIEKDQLRKEIAALQKKIADQKQLEKDLSALKDQFQITYPKSEILLPAKIIGVPRFLPGVSAPSIFIIDKGEKDGVKVRHAVVVKDTVVGKVTKTSKTMAVVTILTDSSSIFSAVTQSFVLGVVRGVDGGNIVFDNILSSQKVSIGEIVVTKGDINEEGIGYLPNLVVGKIISIDKTQSSLFQMVKLKSLLDFSSLSTVFVIVGYE